VFQRVIAVVLLSDSIFCHLMHLYIRYFCKTHRLMMVVEERRSEAEGVGDGRGWLVVGRRRRRWTCSAAETDAVKKPQHGLVDHHHCARTTSQLQDQVRHYDRLLSCFCSSGGITSSGCPSVFACVRACVLGTLQPACRQLLVHS